jgi:hypothetical protein
VDSLDLLRLDDPAIEEARLVAAIATFPGSSIFPPPVDGLRKRASRLSHLRRLAASVTRQTTQPALPAAHQLVAGRTLGRVVVEEVLGCPAFILRTSLSISRQVSHST